MVGFLVLNHVGKNFQILEKDFVSLQMEPIKNLVSKSLIATINTLNTITHLQHKRIVSTYADQLMVQRAAN